MGNCLKYFYQSPDEEKNVDSEDKKTEEEQVPEKLAVISCENNEVVNKRSECSALPSVDIDLPVLILVNEPKLNFEIKDQVKPGVANGDLPQSKGYETFFFQSSSSFSSEPDAEMNDKEKAGAVLSPKHIYQNATPLATKNIVEICANANEKRRKSIRKKLHLPKIKIKSLGKSRKALCTDNSNPGSVSLTRGTDDECEMHHGRLKPLGVVRSEMPSRAITVDDVLILVHQNTPRMQRSSSEEGADQNEEENPAQPSSLPPSLHPPTWKVMYQRLIKKKDAQPKATQEKNGQKAQVQRRKTRLRAKRKPSVSVIEEDETTSGLPLFRECDVLPSTHAILVELGGAGYLASGEESD